MTSLLIVSFKFSSSNTLHDHSNTRRTCFRFKFSQPIDCYSHSRPKITSFGIRKVIYGERLSLFGVNRGDFGTLEEVVRKRKKRAVYVRFNGGGGGWKVDSNTGRILGNLALAVGLTYLSLTGQLGWVLDAIVSVWLLAVILPIVGLGAFLWWAGRDIVQGTCPNCKNDFQIFKSLLGDDLQLCPYCGQPFSGNSQQSWIHSLRFSCLNGSSTIVWLVTSLYRMLLTSPTNLQHMIKHLVTTFLLVQRKEMIHLLQSLMLKLK